MAQSPVLLVLLALLALVQGQACASYDTCGACTAAPFCGWCGATGSCMSSPNGAKPVVCPGYFFFPDSRVISTVDDSQVQPNTFNVFLRQGRPLEVQVRVTPNNLTPLDLLILEDLSESFNNDIVTLRGLFANLSTSVRNIQPDSQFGLATFIDIPNPPFATSVDHVYKTEQPLSANAALTQQALAALQVQDGGDTPESQLYALMIAALRTQEVGWRAGARHIIMMSTDAPYHQAGDGYIVGLVAPNSYNGILTNPPTEDYPAVDQVGQVLANQNIYPVVAVTSNHVATWQAAINRWGFGSVQTLATDSSNIVTAIVDALQDVGSRVQMVKASDTDSVVAAFEPVLGYANVIFGQTVQFNISLYLGAPTANPDGTTSATLAIFGFTSVTINVKSKEPCDCSQVPCPSTTNCSSHGVCMCGKCYCDPTSSYVGPDCACDTSAPCPYNNCSGNGYCDQCQCVCNAGYDGVACNCSVAVCPFNCNNHGTCVCGVCQCDYGYSGDFCQCETNATCAGGCGSGICVCGACQCDGNYIGPNCDICITEACQAPIPCNYTTCDPCFADSQCGWCASSNLCVEQINAASCVGGLATTCVVTAPFAASPTGIAVIAAGVVLFMLIVLIILLKLINWCRDQREWKAFQEDQKSTAWNASLSPVYKDNVRQGQNALYDQRQG